MLVCSICVRRMYGMSVLCMCEEDMECQSVLYVWGGHVMLVCSVCEEDMKCHSVLSGCIGLVPMDASCWVNWGDGIFLLKTSFHYLLSFTFVTFLIHWPLPSVASCVSWCWFCFVCSGLTYQICSGDSPSMYVYCVVCYI